LRRPSSLQEPQPIAPPILDRLQGPSADHWFGTDQQGRDVYSRIVYGARTSIVIGFMVIFVSATLAALIGTVSATSADGSTSSRSAWSISA
jgi:peptide/nickel transport system permease protein